MLPNLFAAPITLDSLIASRKDQKQKSRSTLPKVDGVKAWRPDPDTEPMPMPAMHAVRRIALIGVHHCPVCNSETELNLGQFIESRTSDKDLMRTRCISSADWNKWHALPKDIEYLGVEDRLCPRCLGHMPVDNPAQLRLF